MNHERMLLWAEALETTTERQTTGCLHDADGYCCLGIAIKVAMENGLSVREVAPTVWSNGKYIYQRNLADLPDAVVAWYGFEDEEYPHDPAFGELSYSQLNDVAKKSFKEIAQVVRRHAAQAEGVYTSGLPKPQTSVQDAG